MPTVLPRERVVNAMTIDVEDYFHASALAAAAPMAGWDQLESRVVRNTDRLLELMDEAKVTGTYFILGWVAERQPSLVRRIHAAGHEIASHGYLHQLAYDLDVAQFRHDVRRAKQLLEDLTGARVEGYRAPSYSITRRSLWRSTCWSRKATPTTPASSPSGTIATAFPTRRGIRIT